jgi:hypothetical protein
MRFARIALLAALGAANPAPAQVAAIKYAKMVPIARYLMADQSAEIALARSAAPESIARDAGVMVLGPRGFVTAVKGRNGFVCIVGRGWSSAPEADFWNPTVRVPMCLNAAAVRSSLARITKITELALAGRTPAQVNQAMAAAIEKKELPPMESGAMCYMMGKEGYGGDVIPHWPPHLMFFFSDTDPATWGANLPGSPVFAAVDSLEHLTQFVIPVGHWSDGTEYSPTAPAHARH